MNCIDCGKVIPGGDRCMQCQAAYEQRTERAKKDKADREKIYSQQHTSTSSTYSGSSSSNSRPTNTRTYRSGSGGILKFIIVAIVIVGGFLGFRYWNYTSFEDSLKNEFTIDKEINGDSSSFINEIVNRKNDYAQWSLSFTRIPNDYVSSIFDFVSEKTARIKHWTEDGVDSYYIYFYSDFDMGTGLTGKYYLTTIDGKKCLISDDDEIVYQEGSAFFSEHYEQIMAMTYDAVIPELTKQLAGGEYGTNDDFSTTVLKNDTIFASVDEENDYTKIVDEGGEERMSYVLNYSEKAFEKIPDISDYKIKDK